MHNLEYHWYHNFWARPYTWKPTIRWWNLFLCTAKSQIWQVKSFQYPIFCISEMICWLNSKESRKSIPISRRKCNTVLVYPRNLLTLGFRSTSVKNLGTKEPKFGVKHEKKGICLIVLVSLIQRYRHNADITLTYLSSDIAGFNHQDDIWGCPKFAKIVDGHLFMASLVGICCFNHGVWAFPDSVGQTTKHFAVGFFLAVKICQTPTWFMWPSIIWSYFSIQYLEKYSNNFHHSILECPSVKNNLSIEDLRRHHILQNTIQQSRRSMLQMTGRELNIPGATAVLFFLEWWSLSFNTYYRILQRASQNCRQRFGFHLLLNSLGLHILLGFRWFSWGHHGSQLTCPWRKSLPSMGGALFKNLAAIQELGGILAKGPCQGWLWLKNQ